MPSRAPGRGLSRGRLAIVLAAILLIPAASASADTASISFTDAAGNSDPVAGVGRTFTLTGNTATPTNVWIKHRAAGGAPCAPSYSSDSGDAGFSGFSGDQFNDTNVNGNFTLKKTGSWPRPETEMFCIWFAASSTTSTTPITQTVTFRAATGTISATLNPLQPKPGETVTLTVTGASEAPKEVFAKVRPAGGAPCAATASADSGDSVISGRDVNGSFSVSDTVRFSTPGSYVACLWLADSSTDASPVAGPQPVPFTVLAPPPPCIVPSIAAGAALSQVTTALTGAHCTLGAVRYSASRTYAKGTLIKLTPVAGTQLATSAPVDVLLSSGRPCRVPSAGRGLSIASARARLRAAGCVPGSVRKQRSRRRRGTVVRFSPSTGAVRPGGSRVTIVVSRGRR